MRSNMSAIFYNRMIRATAAITLGLIYLVALAAPALSALNPQINYQGKLTDSSGNAVTDVYNMQFKLYDAATGGNLIWMETLCYSSDNGDNCAGSGTDSRVTVTSGLFSVLLGAVSSTTLASINFNQTLFLGVNIGGVSATPSWDGE